VNPSGKLPITFPQREQDLPQPAISQTDTVVNYAEGLNMGYRWFDAKGIVPLFPFGHGLSYTSFSYSSLNAVKQSNGDLAVRVTLKNDGVKAGAEVVQVYATLPAETNEPPKRLVAWQKVYLLPGEARQVTIPVQNKRLSIWNTATHAFETVAGSYGLLVGGSSRAPDMLSTSLTL
jgi:beta-glucosidase